MANKFVLKRAYTDAGTFGKLYLNGEFFSYTVERKDEGNMPFISCIPGGYTYQIVPVDSPKYGAVFGLTNKRIGVGLTKGLRTHILVHAANLPSQLAGCVALGENLGVLDGKWAVLQSKSAVERFYDVCRQSENNTLEIV